ncbi:SO_0444 family Cu/Zn efflux transporter [Desulfobacter curvatus]|uniref:SO_0444 family Cu/Zn efflux transporter n=1 Tax=Desulfobacter curvatus TaxID=2290 RepID=UPI00038130D7|nr:SO_0444 family Cu/Zn efflux transporter [Desulfobacter curvatus]
MMTTIKNIILEIWHVYLDVSVFMLFGFFVAALLYVFFKADRIKKYLGKGRVKPVLRSALFGIPIPLCSCGVIPVVTGLKKQGANDGAALAFMIATPESGVDSIAVSWAMLDPVMTIIRPIAGLITAISTGITANIFSSGGQKKTTATPDPFFVQSPIPEHTCNCSSGSCTNAPGETVHEPPFSKRLAQGMNFAFGELLIDIAKPFAVGIFIAGLITFFFPSGISAWSQNNPLLSMLIMLVAGIPMYVCATSSTPIAAALILKGLNPGAALVFLLAGPATNAATMGVVKNIFGGRALAIYLGMISICSLAMGGLLDLIYRLLAIQPSVVMGKASEVLPYGVELTAAIILTALLARSLFKRQDCHCHDHDHHEKTSTKH